MNPQHVFVDGVNLAESLNGGLTWTTSQTPHADQHGVEFDPFTPGRVYLGNDGGFYSVERRTARRAGVDQDGPRLPVTQFYAMDVSVQDGSRVNAGSQDNGSLKSWNNANTVTGDWNNFVGGDGMMNRIDPTNDRKFYGCSQNGGCRRFFPGGPNNGVSMTIPGARKNWVAPLEFAADPRFMFGASEAVYRIDSEPLDTTAPRPWLQISPDLTEGTEPRAPGFGTITALGTTDADPNLLYAGTDSGLMWVSRNAMADPAAVTWTELESPLFPGRWVTRITVDPDNAKIAWATFSGWRNGDGLPAHRHDERRRQHVGGHRRQEAPAGAHQRRHPPPVEAEVALHRHRRRRLPDDEPRQDVAQGGRQPAARAGQRHRPAGRQQHALRGDLRSQRLDDVARRRFLS